MNPVVSYIKQTLQGYYPDSELVPMAKLLLTQVFGMSVVELYAGKDTTFSVNERKQLDDILVRLQKLEPIQYIIGTEEFYGLTFEVNKHVLIPRPETGELVDWIIREHKYGRVRILDIGTGSGCIAVSLAKNLEEAEVVSWDVSEKALQVAERNCRRNGVRVTLEQRDVLLASPAGERFDVIVSNPPYITEKERADMSANVLEWEPELALFVPDDSPLLFYRKIAELGRDMLVSGGRLYFEINQEYGRETVDMLAGLEYKNIELRKDIENKGLVISEFPLGTLSKPVNFPIRNRIIAGLSRGTVVIESSDKSGSLITANLAFDEGRDIFAVPGDITSEYSKGCNELIKIQQAKLITDAKDILIEYGWESKEDNNDAKSNLFGDKKKIFDSLGTKLSLDEIKSRISLDTSTILSYLMELELEGVVKSLPGGYYQKIE